MPRLCSLLPRLSYVRYMYVYLYLKSRNHDLLKELDGNYGIIEGASLMSR